uniref:[Protein ADP-ribosylarginine] hydrolase n=1 Tax=Accipiter nisus TaxID=211598 RepID=A0A8B9N8L2_9AVES
VEAYEAAMVLSGVGDALGYRGGRWEYCTSGPQIHAELAELGGLEAITLEPPEWPVSDDTVLHLATAEGLATDTGEGPQERASPSYPRPTVERVFGGGGGAVIPLGCMPVPWGGGLEVPVINLGLHGGGPGVDKGGGMGIGTRYPHARELPTLIRVSIESGRMTHHHPTGYLGALAVALFGALGARGEPPERWGAELLRVLPLAWDYVEGAGVAVGDNAAAWPFFGDAWYLESRGLLEGHGPPQVPSLPSPAERDAAYLGWALEGWPGRSGHDAPMVALEALLAAGGCWGDLRILCGVLGSSGGSLGVSWDLRGVLGGLGRVPGGHLGPSQGPGVLGRAP